ncbi:MAG: anti-sigma factor antagonist [Desulfobulbaceae bacterium]|nr:anti-sigma factor antagonist [Desulfobulbaceae bacterium]
METLFTERKNCLVVVPPERLDTITSPEAAETITEKIQSGEHKIIFDFSRTDYVSSAGLRVILVALKLLKKTNGKMALCNANDQILEVLEISGFHSLVKYLGSLDEAVAFVSG